MRKYIFYLIIASSISCQTIKIKDTTYKTSNASTEIGSIGGSKSALLKNEFTTKVFPILNNKIRTEVTIVPFNKKANKLYANKAKYNQNQAKIQYIDSLATKPEMVTISILDLSGYVAEINSENNKEVVNYLKTTKKSKIVTSIATTLSNENISKIKQADTYYLTNNQDKKYTLTLYKSNKKTETIDLQSGVVLGYELSKCCWAINKKHNWYLVDLVKDCKSCPGNTYSKVDQEKQNESLFKM